MPHNSLRDATAAAMAHDLAAYQLIKPLAALPKAYILSIWMFIRFKFFIRPVKWTCAFHLSTRESCQVTATAAAEHHIF